MKQCATSHGSCPCEAKRVNLSCIAMGALYGIYVFIVLIGLVQLNLDSSEFHIALIKRTSF